MDDDFVIGRRVEDQVGVGVSDHAAKAARTRELAGPRMRRDEVDDRLNARLDATTAPEERSSMYDRTCSSS